MTENDRGPSDQDLSIKLRTALEWLLADVPEEKRLEAVEHLVYNGFSIYVVP